MDTENQYVIRETFTAANPPKYVGYYQLGEFPYDVRISFPERPSRWHQFWMKFFFGFRWKDFIGGGEVR